MNNVLKILYIRALCKDRTVEDCVDLVMSDIYFMNSERHMDSIRDNKIETNVFIMKNGGRWNSEFWQLERR